MALPTTDRSLLAPVFDDLEPMLDDVAELVSRRLHAEQPVYRAIPRDVLTVTVRSNAGVALAGMRGSHPPTAAELQRLAATGAERALQGFPLEAVQHAYRAGFSEAWARIPAIATHRGLDVEGALALATIFMTWADAAMDAVANAHAHVGSQLAREDQQRRDSFLRALLSGTLHDEDLARACAGFGLDTASEYVPARVRASEGAWTHGLPHRVELALGGRPGVVGQLDGDTVAVAAAAPDAIADTTIALGPPARPRDLPVAYAVATRTLQTAQACGIEGVVRIDDLSIRPAVLADDTLGDLFQARYIDPLAPLGRLGEEIQTTLRAWLDNGMRYEETARALHVHANTIRHRLRRFEELTDCTLRETSTILEVWWALERTTATSA